MYGLTYCKKTHLALGEPHLALGNIGGPPSWVKRVRLWSYLDFTGNNLAVAVAAGRLYSGLTCLKDVAAALIGECALHCGI